MKRRKFFLVGGRELFSLVRKLEKGKGVTVTLAGLDPRFVAQLRVAAESRGMTLEQWIVYAAVMYSGYHLNSGFVDGK